MRYFVGYSKRNIYGSWIINQGQEEIKFKFVESRKSEFSGGSLKWKK